jgi:adenylate cyclase class 2
MSRGSHEIEIKLKGTDVASARRMLYRAGFRVYKRRRFEDNTVFDTPKRTLRRAAKLLRLREAGGRAIVTFKGKPLEGKHKSREELETDVSDPRKWWAIIGRLGFAPVFQYQKYRTEYKQPKGSGIATLDETPIGIYLELEGQPGWIDRTAKKMGFTENDYITSSYGRLYLEWCKRNRTKPKDMIFKR